MSTDLPTTTTEPIRDLVDALLVWGGLASQIVNHMAANATPPRTSGYVGTPDVLPRLLWSVLEPALQDRSADDLLTAAGTVRAVSDTVCDEIVLVDLERPPVGGNRATRRRRGPRRRP